MLSGRDSELVDDQSPLAGLKIAQIFKKPFRSCGSFLASVCRFVGHELESETTIHDGEHSLRLTMHSRVTTAHASCYLTGFRLKAVVLNLLVQCIAVDSQPDGGLGLRPLAGAQDLQQDFLFDQRDDFLVNVLRVFTGFN